MMSISMLQIRSFGVELLGRKRGESFHFTFQGRPPHPWEGKEKGKEEGLCSAPRMTA